MSHIFTDVINNPAYNEKPLALVVAGTAEIGRNVIDSLINDGYLVVFTWFSNETVVSDMKHRYQSAVLPARLDLTSEQDVVQFCTTLENIKIDVAIYCAGHNPVCLCDELEPENISTTTRLNYLSAVLIFNAIVKTMKEYKENETKLVFISSVAAKKISLGNSLYGSTKAAMERYLSSVALEMARFNIRTLCLSPGYIKTKMLQDYCVKEGRSIASIEKTIPMRKMLATEDVANAVRSFINGTIITTGVSLTIGNGEGII
ncbi:SDR family NAD(P)-dependent oxidoreductase [Salmonella enterica subsp. enterica]|nr:SDR family NAD(P)-dependent oxidoreductase [Salmonella enterica subsp. enterica]